MNADAILAALEDTAADITDAGVPCSLERARVDAGEAWLTVQTIDVTTLAGGGTVRAYLFLVGPMGAEDVTTLTELAGMLEKVLTVVTPVEPVDTSYGVTLPHTTGTFPSFRLDLDLDI
jgi:hypothetical protein